MSFLKSLLIWIPEIYLMLASIYYWIMTETLINPIAIGLVVALIFQIFLKKKIMGLIISILFIILSLFMVLALLSEFFEYPALTIDAKQLIIVGSIFLGLNLIMSIAMIIKYIKIQTLKV